MLTSSGQRESNAPFLRRQVVALPPGQRRERAANGLEGGVDLVLPASLAGILVELQGPVHDIQVAVVVNETAVGVDFGIDTRPETDVRLDFRRARQLLSDKIACQEGNYATCQ